jgi:hypothetical protein
MPVNGPPGGLCYPCRTLPRSRGRGPPATGMARASRMFDAKDIPHWLDVWRWAKHDWPLWWDMFPRYLAKL